MAQRSARSPIRSTPCSVRCSEWYGVAVLRLTVRADRNNLIAWLQSSRAHSVELESWGSLQADSSGTKGLYEGLCCVHPSCSQLDEGRVTSVIASAVAFLFGAIGPAALVGWFLIPH